MATKRRRRKAKPGEMRGRNVPRAEERSRLDQVTELLARFTPTHEVATLLSQPKDKGGWGVGPRRVYAYIKRVREQLDHLGLEIDPEKLGINPAMLVAGIKSTIADAHLANDRRTALLGYDKLAQIRGLYRNKVEVSGPAGAPLAVDVVQHFDLTDCSEEELDALDRLTARQLAGRAPGAAGEGTGGEGQAKR